MNRCSELSNIKNRFLKRIKEISCDRINYSNTITSINNKYHQIPIFDHMMLFFIIILLIILYLIS